MIDHVSAAYDRRAAEYVELVGTMAAVHPSDVQLVTTWADSIRGPALDVGCGPGQWTDFLFQRGVDVRGIDPTPAFIAHARATYPDVRFDLGDARDLDIDTGTLGGVLSWYSLIHLEPDEIQTPLREFARVLTPGADLLIGFFDGPTLESFEHKVVTAYRWPVSRLGDELRDAGFDVIETHTRTELIHRPHGAILARRRETR